MVLDAKYTQNSLQIAIQATKVGESVNDAAKLYGVPRETLRGRIHGGTSMIVAKERFQRFSPRHEKYICDWIRYIQEAKGTPPSNKQIAEFASGFLTGRESKPLGVNWIRGFLSRHPEIKARLSGQKRLAPRVMHESELSFHWSEALHFQLEIFELARCDPRWVSVSRFEFPGAAETNHTLKCAMKHLQANDIINGGRILRKAFQTLDEEIVEGDLNVIQDICLNVFRATVDCDFPKIGTLMLQHCSNLFGKNHKQQLYCVFFKALSRVPCNDKAQMDHYLSQLTRLYAVELEQIRPSSNRSYIQARRRRCSIGRDFKTTATTEEVEILMHSCEQLLTSAISELGIEHDKTLRIENETLRMQFYIGRYQPDYIARVDRSIDRIIGWYTFERGPVPFEGWEKSHQTAYLRLLERKLDYYKYTEDSDNAIKMAQCIFEKEGYQTERWIVLSLDFESWLRKIGYHGWSSSYQQKRLRSSYYRQLEERLAADEEDLLKRAVQQNLYPGTA